MSTRTDVPGSAIVHFHRFKRISGKSSHFRGVIYAARVDCLQFTSIETDWRESGDRQAPTCRMVYLLVFRRSVESTTIRFADDIDGFLEIKLGCLAGF